MRLLRINLLKMLPALMPVMFVFSCSPVSYMTDTGSEVECNGRMVYCDIEGKQFTFPLDEEYPVQVPGMSGEAQGEYLKWNRRAEYYASRYAPQSDYILFTVPGVVVACVEDSAGRDDIVPQIDMMVRGYVDPSFNDLVGRDTTYWAYGPRAAWKSREPGEGIKGRSIDRDARTRSGILVDHVLLGNGRMLALIYPIDGKEHYRTGPDGKLEYKFGGYSELWDPDVDKLMSYKYVRKKCDEVTFKIVEGIMGWL